MPSILQIKFYIEWVIPHYVYTYKFITLTGYQYQECVEGNRDSCVVAGPAIVVSPPHQHLEEFGDDDQDNEINGKWRT